MGGKMKEYIKSLFDEKSTNSLSRWLSFFSFVIAVLFSVIDIVSDKDLQSIWIAFLTFSGTVKVGNKVFENKK